MRIDKPVLGQYRLLGRIGYGGMAEVYYAQHLNDESQEVAVKAIRTDLTEDPSITRRFLREVRALSRLSHPHILSLLDWGEEEERIYLVLPWISGGSLSHLLQTRGGFLPIEQAVPLFGQLCSAVQYTHEHNIIHRDIKPQNVLIQQGNHVLLTDFGIAKDPTDTRMTLTGCGMGSVNYMAPEQALGQASSRSDLYSLGIVLYQLLTGAVPFSAESPLQVLLQQAHAPLPDPRQFQPTLPPGLVEILQTALAQDPDARFPSVHDFWLAVQPFENPSSLPHPSADIALEGRPGRRPLTTGRPDWYEGLEIPNRSATEPAYENSKHSLAKQPTAKLAAARQKKPFALNLKMHQQSSASRQRPHLTRQQKTFLRGSMAVAFLLLVGVGVLGFSQPFQASQHATSASQSAPQPSPPRKTAPTPRPSPTPAHPRSPQAGNGDDGNGQGGNGGHKGGNGHDGGSDGGDN
ncbi:MAG TPA: serine/threonine-protein kinase [Ktedonobacterales bacterium]|nr:serine/threonine-protein kinase [Ktedonobacterales bacterium]